MITLNGVALSGSLQWTDRHSFSGVAQENKRTLGGNSVIYSKKLIAGRPVTLVATEETGWITKTMLDALEAMADTLGVVYTLDLHGTILSVVFRHEDAPALEFVPLQPRSIPLGGDYYAGTIKLITV